MNTLPFYQVDAFADRPFAGNPAAVMPLDAWLPDPVMQAIAAENNLAETAFLVAEPAGWRIRWFTPTTEVDLCGHATLASAHVLFDSGRASGDRVIFQSRSGELAVSRGDGRLTLDFPARPARACLIPDDLARVLGVPILQAAKARDLMLVVATAEQVRSLTPDMAGLAEVDAFGIMVTAPGDNCDFVSRFFAPREGIPEDPVTGSAHCTLVPYWAKRLGKTQLHARQVSPRGGELFCELAGDRVLISGNAVTVIEGRFRSPT